MRGARPTLTTILSTTADCSPFSPSHVTLSSRAPSMPVTRTPTWTFTPRFLNDRATTAPASASVMGRMRGSASSSVTSLPTSTSIDANSAPITPPPMIATRGGTSSSSSTWSDDSTRTPSKSRPGSDRGTEPVASINDPPMSSVPSDTRMWRAAASTMVPVPGTIVTLRLRSRDSRPFVSRSTTSRLRTWLRARSIFVNPASTPNSGALLTVRTTSAVWSSSLAGMQPRWRHTPPTRASSTSAMRSPAAAPYKAVA